MSNWKNILIKILWSLAGIAMMVLFVFAWRAKATKKCTGIDIVITGNAGNFIFMDEQEIMKLVNEQGVKVGTPIAHIQLHKMEELLMATKWVEHTKIYLDNQQKLIINIEQRVPVARIFTMSGNSFYIDKVAQKLPLRQLSVLRLPIFTGFPSDQDKLSKPDSSLLQDILKFTSVIQKDSFFLAQFAQVNLTANGDFEIIPTIGSHTVLIGKPDQLEDKLNRLFTFYKKVWVPAGLNAYAVLDLRFDHQLVAIKKGMQPIQYTAGSLPMIHLDSMLQDAGAIQDSLQKIPISKADTILKIVTPKVDTANKQATLKVANTAVQKGANPAKQLSTNVSKQIAKQNGKQKISKNNKVNNKTLNNTKVAPKAILLKKPPSNNNKTTKKL